MVVYDYSKESSLNSLVFCAISLICILCLIFLMVLAVRTYMKKGCGEHFIILILAAVASLILSVFLSHHAFVLSKYNAICVHGNYETTTGEIEIIAISQNDYRDEELYSIDFVVNGVAFNNLVNSFSKEQKEILTSIERQVEIRYSYLKGEMVIYQIVAYTEE